MFLSLSIINKWMPLIIHMQYKSYAIQKLNRDCTHKYQFTLQRVPINWSSHRAKV